MRYYCLFNFSVDIHLVGSGHRSRLLFQHFLLYSFIIYASTLGNTSTGLADFCVLGATLVGTLHINIVCHCYCLAYSPDLTMTAAVRDPVSISSGDDGRQFPPLLPVDFASLV